jgi:hypothetical protein
MYLEVRFIIIIIIIIIIIVTTITTQNDIHDEIKSTLNSGNTCYYSVQNICSSCLISKNLTTVILPVVLYGCELSLSF